MPILIACLMFFGNSSGLKFVKKKTLDFLGDPGKIFSFVVDESDFSYLTVLATPQILVFDPSGKALDSIGVRGKGPGEFQYPKAMTYYDKYLYMIDEGRDLLYKINPKTHAVEKEWVMDSANKIRIQNDVVVVALNSPLRSGMFGQAKLGGDLKFESTFFPVPEAIEFPGTKTSGLTFDANGHIWAAYSGDYLIVEIADGKIVRRITEAPDDYVLPKAPGSRYNTKAASENYRSFDKMKGLFLVKNQVVLYRNKSFENGRLDIYHTNGKPLVVGVFLRLVIPFQVVNETLWGYRMNMEDDVEIVEISW